MKFNMALAGAFVAGFILPVAVQAQTPVVDSYYVVQDVKTKKCTVMEKRPQATETTVTVIDGVAYKTRTEAEGAVKTVKTCTTE
jgi:hypothetical protein